MVLMFCIRFRMFATYSVHVHSTCNIDSKATCKIVCLVPNSVNVCLGSIEIGKQLKQAIYLQLYYFPRHQ
jgi:hypothetical protein